MSRIARLVRMVELLQSTKIHNVTSLSHSLGVARRTVYRDLDLLRHSGVKVTCTQHKGGYTVPQPPSPNMGLEPDEILVTALAARVLAKSLGPALGNVLQLAVDSLLERCPVEHRRAINRILRVVVPDQKSVGRQSHTGKLIQILAAARGRKKLTVLHDAEGGGDPVYTAFACFWLPIPNLDWSLAGRPLGSEHIRTIPFRAIRKLDVVAED